MDYKNSKIYSIRTFQTDDVYIGSTTQKLSKRLYCHKRDYNKYLNGNHHYVSSFEIVKYDDCYIELIEEYPCENKEQLVKREGEFIRANKCVNKQIAGRTNKEYYEDNKERILGNFKKYRELNKDKLVEYNKQYRELNKDKIAEYMKEYKKEYYQENKDKLSEQSKQYREKNKEQISQHRKEYYMKNKESIKSYYEQTKDIISEKRKANLFDCECGVCIRFSDRCRHFKSKKHQNYLIQAKDLNSELNVDVNSIQS